ncbi:hypothetical protein P0L94_15900 [Microbacter sp. GSS18]|nr:hypothetical protein P0L94_15900 [Microbacter sp. GSS18]
MGEISFGQLVAANFWLVLVVAVVLAAVALAIVVRTRRRRRRMPAVIDGIRFECQDVRVVDDMVVEQDWQVTFLLTNVTKQPAPMPAIGARGVVRAGNASYAGSVVVERSATELNPGDHVVLWLSLRLPAGRVPTRGALALMRTKGELEILFAVATETIVTTRA